MTIYYKFKMQYMVTKLQPQASNERRSILMTWSRCRLKCCGLIWAYQNIEVNARAHIVKSKSILISMRNYHFKFSVFVAWLKNEIFWQDISIGFDIYYASLIMQWWMIKLLLTERRDFYNKMPRRIVDWHALREKCPCHQIAWIALKISFVLKASLKKSKWI